MKAGQGRRGQCRADIGPAMLAEGAESSPLLPDVISRPAGSLGWLLPHSPIFTPMRHGRTQKKQQKHELDVVVADGTGSDLKSEILLLKRRATAGWLVPGPTEAVVLQTVCHLALS